MAVTGTNITLVLRAEKGSILEEDELDGNQSELKDAIENHGHDGLSITVTASEPLGGHRVVTMSGLYADSSNPSHAYTIAGITLQAVASGAPVEAQYIGELTEPSWAWTPAEPVFLGGNGMLTHTAPDAGFILQIGIPITSTTLLIDIQQPLYIA